jgi:aspartate/methionine/tyrosine aminotransferase
MSDYDRALFYFVAAYAAEVERDVVDMVSGEPDWDPPAALRAGLCEYADAAAADFQYPPCEGISALRERIARRRSVPVERVIVTHGAGEANHVATAEGLAAHSGNAVLLTDPTYPYYPSRADLLGAEVRQVPVDGAGRFDVDAARERATDDVAVIVANSPNNPTGAVYGAERMAALVDLAERHDALLVSDETYRDFDFSGRFSSALEVDSTHRAVAGSFSKSLAITGWRVGYLIVPERLFDAARKRHMLATVTGSRPAQYAVARALAETDHAYFERNCERVRDRAARFTAALEAAGADYVDPEGGCYVMARFADFPGTLENVKRLIEEAGVAPMPGETFGDARADWFRFALCTPRVEMAAERLADYFARSPVE